MAIVIGGGSGNAISINSSAGSSGKVIGSDGTNASWVNNTGGQGAVYTSPGTFTVGTNCPTSVNTIKITCMGGGGNGGAGFKGPTSNHWAGGGASIRTLLRALANQQKGCLSPLS